MSFESAVDREQQWVLVVRRSFGIPDLVGSDDATKALVVQLQDQLVENGWRGPTRTIAEPMVNALMVLGRSDDPDDLLLPEALQLSAEAFDARVAASRLIDMGMALVDPEHLVFDLTSDYPPEILAVARQIMERVGEYLRGEPFDE